MRARGSLTTGRVRGPRTALALVLGLQAIAVAAWGTPLSVGATPNPPADPPVGPFEGSSADGLERAFPNFFGFSVYPRPWSGFSSGDHIAIRVIRGNQRGTQAGGLYAVMGSYTLVSMDHAILGLFQTVPPQGPTPVFHSQWARISKGSGTFLLWYEKKFYGEPHVSFYPLEPGMEARGGVYFKVIPQPVFRFFLPPRGRVEIGKPVFQNFIDGPPPP
jgi:hypothetical protein